MTGDAGEVLIGSEQGKSMLAAGGGNQEVDWTGIDSLRTADRSQTGSGNIGLSIQLKKWVWIEEGQQAVELFRRAESVEEFLQDIADQKEPIAGFKMPPKGTDVGIVFIDPWSS